MPARTQRAARLLDGAMRRGTKVRLIGVRAANLTSARQLSLFDGPDRRREQVDTAVDESRERYGDDAVRRGSLVD